MDTSVRTASSRVVPIVALASTVLVAALWVGGPYVFAGRDDRSSIDSPPVRQRAMAACTEMRARLQAAAAEADPPARAEAENQAVEAMVARIRELGPGVLTRDVPTEAWLDDWERLLAARRQATATGSSFSVPEADGAPVNLRMFDLVKGGLRPCDVPDPLLAPRPGVPEDSPATRRP